MKVVGIQREALSLPEDQRARLAADLLESRSANMANSAQFKVELSR